MKAYANATTNEVEKADRGAKVEKVLAIQKSKTTESKSVKVGIKEAKKAMRKIFSSELGTILPTLPIVSVDGRVKDIAPPRNIDGA